MNHDPRWVGNYEKIENLFANLIDNIILQKDTSLTLEVIEAAMNDDHDFIRVIPNQRLVDQQAKNDKTNIDDITKHNKTNKEFLEYVALFKRGEISKEL